MGDINTDEAQSSYLVKWLIYTLTSKDFPAIIQLTALVFGYGKMKEDGSTGQDYLPNDLH